MSFESIIAHMNDHHHENLIDLVKKYAGEKEVKNALLKGVDYEGLDIVYNDGQKTRVPFAKKADENTIKDMIITLCQEAKAPGGKDLEKVKEEYKKFKAEFGSVCLATLNEKGEAQCTYAPIIQDESADYILVSEVAEHYANIKHNPNNVEVMFLEDEDKAASIILRKRLRFRAHAKFLPRDNDFEAVFDLFEKRNGSAGGISVVRKMLDFHLVKLDYKEGRFVKGFGQAYSIDEKGEIKHLGSGSGNPHKMQHPHK